MKWTVELPMQSFNYVTASAEEIINYDRITIEDIEHMAKMLNKVLSPEQITEVFESYPDERLNDLNGLTVLIIEECIYSVLNE